MIDLDRFRATPLEGEPFEHVVTEGFLESGSVGPLLSDFPVIEKGGSFPVSEVSCGPAFEGLLQELRGPKLKRAVEEKFDVDLTDRPTMVTVRGQARPKDGRIHTDSKTKLITVLLYLNAGWRVDGGHLRLLRSDKSLDDYFADVAPEAGTAVFFRCTDRAWHGHTPYVGKRQSVQLNWVTDDSVVAYEQRRHRISARWKRWLPF